MPLRTFIILLCMTLAAPAQDAPVPRTIIVFGDSITAGSALPKEQQDRVWVKLVEAQSAGALRLINEGKGGRPTDSVKEFEAVLQHHAKPDALVIALGMNDSRDITTGCVPKAVANVRTMIEKSRQVWGGKLPVLLVGPTNINKEALGPTKPIANERETKLRELGDAFSRLAAETQSGFISLFGVVPGPSLLKDGVHPDVAGNAAMAKALQAKLHKMVGK